MEKFDVTVIGSGPGGYVAAIRCAQLGLKTAIIEKYDTLGGTCLNVGCIPSKALLDSTEHFHNAKYYFKDHGIKINAPKPDLPTMIARKKNVVDQNTAGIDFLMKKNKITVFHGLGSFKDKKTVSIKPSKGRAKSIETDKVIIATGSKPFTIPGLKIDKKRIITSTEALELTKIPRHLIIVGGGIIGLELGSVFGRIGSKITVLEYADSLIGEMDRDLGKEIGKVLKKQIDIDIKLSHRVTGAVVKGAKVEVTAEDKTGKEVKVSGDYCLVAIGRAPYTEGLGLENVGIETDERGRIKTNDHLETSVEGIYAIGDVIEGAMLAHKAEEEGVMVAEFIAGQKPHINYNLIPGVLYTWPEVAAVGFTEEELKENEIPYKSGKFPFLASGRARASMSTDGFIKVLAHAETDEILGVHMIGPRIADLIAEAVVAMEYKATAEDVSRMSHAHPTFAEAFKEACLAATENRAIHI